MKKLDLAVSVHNYQKRFCWMLSSLLECEQIDRINISVAFIEGTGSPPVRDILDLFSGGLDINYMPYPDEKIFQYRGQVRNKVVEETNCEWIFFSDGDLVFPPDYFRQLFHFLDNDYKDSNCMHYGSRVSRGRLPEIERLMAEYIYPIKIDNPHRILCQFPPFGTTNIGAGFCQIARRDAILEKIGFYEKPGTSRDWNWSKKRWKTRSDAGFRRRMGKKGLKLPPIVHMEHLRDKDFNCHVDIER